MIHFHNVHERWIGHDMAAARALLDSLSSPQDRLWPRSQWPAMRLRPNLAPGASGGHGIIRYDVDTYEPGEHVSFRFDPRTGFEGTHRLDLLQAKRGVLLRHEIQGRSDLRGWLYWQTIVRPLHDALLEDALDNAERALLGEVATPARWSPWVRLLRAAFARLPRVEA